MSATQLLIWDFDGTLAHRRGETGWSILLAETLDAEEPGHGYSADTFRPHLREGFPWHRPEVAHPELCEPEAWWAAVRPQLGRAYEAAGYPSARALELADAARRLYVDPDVGWALFDDTLPTLEPPRSLTAREVTHRERMLKHLREDRDQALGTGH